MPAKDIVYLVKQICCLKNIIKETLTFLPAKTIWSVEFFDFEMWSVYLKDLLLKSQIPVREFDQYSAQAGTYG